MKTINGKLIIGIAGKKRSGKDYTANQLVKDFFDAGLEAKILHFADPLKDIIAKTFGIGQSRQERLKNAEATVFVQDGEELTEISNFRKILQNFGTEAMKPYFGKEVWANLLVDKIEKSDYDVCIIPDMRFEEEYKLLLNKYRANFHTVKIKGVEEESLDNHASEKELNLLYNFEIDNTKKRPETIEKASKLIVTTLSEKEKG